MIKKTAKWLHQEVESHIREFLYSCKSAVEVQLTVRITTKSRLQIPQFTYTHHARDSRSVRAFYSWFKWFTISVSISGTDKETGLVRRKAFDGSKYWIRFLLYSNFKVSSAYVHLLTGKPPRNLLRKKLRTKNQYLFAVSWKGADPFISQITSRRIPQMFAEVRQKFPQRFVKTNVWI